MPVIVATIVPICSDFSADQGELVRVAQASHRLGARRHEKRSQSAHSRESRCAHTRVIARVPANLSGPMPAALERGARS
jgi:hypothetical protein